MLGIELQRLDVFGSETKRKIFSGKNVTFFTRLEVNYGRGVTLSSSVFIIQIISEKVKFDFAKLCKERFSVFI